MPRQAVRVKLDAGCADPVFDRAEMSRVRGWGVVGCAIVKYRREGHGDRVGLVYLRGYLFDDVAGASAGLRRLRADYVARASGAPLVSKRGLPAAALGDEAPRGVRLEFGEQGSALTYWWRRGKAVAVLVVSNVPREPDRRAALALARRIDARATS